jgi:hypothetical protein
VLGIRFVHDLANRVYALLNAPIVVTHDLSDRAARILAALVAPPSHAGPHFHFSRIAISGGISFEGDITLQDVTITDLQTISGQLFGVDAEGHDTTLDGVTVTAESNNTAVCSASVADGRLSIAADGSDLGLAQVTLTGTFPDGSSAQDVVNVTVIASAATGFRVAFDPPTP